MTTSGLYATVKSLVR